MAAFLEENIGKMNSLDGFNVVIVCCSSDLQADYWQTRLEAGQGSVLSTSCKIVAVFEDWPGGAGNGTYVQLVHTSMHDANTFLTRNAHTHTHIYL